MRDPATGTGTASEPVEPAKQNAFTLNDVQVAELGDLGRRVEQFYEGIPQDIEWALADGTFYLLQSRDITGGGAELIVHLARLGTDVDRLPEEVLDLAVAAELRAAVG